MDFYKTKFCFDPVQLQVTKCVNIWAQGSDYTFFSKKQVETGIYHAPKRAEAWFEIHKAGKGPFY